MCEDLEQGRWLCGKEEDARIVFELCQERQSEFKDVPFSQFEVRHNESTQKAQKCRARLAEEDQWMKHDRMISPQQTYNERGEPVFDMDEKAKKQLQEDVKRKLHKAMSPSELWEGLICPSQMQIKDISASHPPRDPATKLFEITARRRER